MRIVGPHRLRLALISVLATTVLTPTLPARPAAAQPSFTSGDWGSSDGGAVTVKANGAYEILVTDASTGASIYSTGKVVSRRPQGDTLELTLKPSVQTGAKNDLYVVVVRADGGAELYAVASGQRHKAADLKK